MAQILDLATDHGALFLQVLPDELIVLTDFLEVLVLLLQVVALLYNVFYVALDLRLNLLVLLGLPSLLFELLFELFDLAVDLLFAAHHFFKLSSFLEKQSAAFLNGCVDLVLVLEMKLSHLAINCLQVVAQLITHRLLTDKCRTDIDELLEELAVFGAQLQVLLFAGSLHIVLDSFHEGSQAFAQRSAR